MQPHLEMIVKAPRAGRRPLSAGATGASTSEAGIPVLRDDFDRLRSYPVVDVLDVG